MKIDKRKALSLLNQVVKECGPDHTVDICEYSVYDYGTCEYADLPNCIAGRVLHKIDPQILQEINERGLGSTDFLEITGKYPDAFLDTTFTKGAINVLTVAQRVQDGRVNKLREDMKPKDYTFGEALRMARMV